MEDAFLDKKSVKLVVYDCVGEKLEYVKAMLTILSGLNVDRGRGVLLGKRLYAYFDDIASAKEAAFAVVHIACCKTKLRTGTFDVTNLVRDNNATTLKDLRLQARVSKTRLAKEAIYAINAIKYSNL